MGVQDSAVWREVRGQLPEKQALLQAGRPTGLLRLPALLTPPTGLKRGGGLVGAAEMMWNQREYIKCGP